MKKRAQIVGKLFVYIIAITFGSILLLFGYNTLTKFKEKTEEVDYVHMKDNLTNSTNTISADDSSVVKKEISIPYRYKEVCFVRTYGGLPYPDVISNSYLIIKKSVIAGVDKNVFLVDDMAERPFYVGDITVKDDFLCIPVLNGKISLRLEGKGNHVDVSEWVG